MWNQIKSWLIPHPLAEEAQRIANLLAFIMTAFAVGVPVYGVVVLVDDPQLVLPRFITLSLFVAFLGAMVYLMRQGQVMLAGQLLVGQMWLGLTFFVFIDGGINSPAFHWYIIIIIVAGLITGVRGLLVTTAVSVFISVSIVLLNLGNMFPAVDYDPVYIWALDVSAFVFAAAFLALAVNGLRQSLQRARAAEASWRTLVEENPDYIVLVERDALAQPAADQTLAPLLARLPESAHATFFATLQEVFDRQQTRGFDYSHHGTDYSLRANPVMIGSRASAVIVTLRDITENRAAERQRLQLAVETEKLELLQALVADVTHDMKTPLSTIETGLYMLQRTNPDIEPERLDRIRVQTESLNLMVQNLLTIMRLDSLPALDFVEVDLDTLCERLREQFSPLAQQQAVALQIAVADEARTIRADADEFKRVLVNLLENALQYTPSGGTVSLRAARRSDAVVIDIEDTGIGLSEGDLKHVFERFFRAEEARRRVQSGSGLGLAIVKRIIDMHGGEIEVASAPGQGTRFRLRLPQARATRPGIPAVTPTA